jgi:hypothetical protein
VPLPAASIAVAIGYASTQTGNLDLTLPFIEKGIALLDNQARLSSANLPAKR